MLLVRVRPLPLRTSMVPLSTLPLSSTKWGRLNMPLLLRPPFNDKGLSFIVFIRNV